MHLFTSWMAVIFIVTCTAHLAIPASDASPPGEFHENTFFDSEEIIDLTIEGPINNLMKDRGKDHEYHSLQLKYALNDEEYDLSIKARTRGNFRRQRDNCKIPPLTLNFKNDSITNASIFKGQNKLKLVLPCQEEKYVIREYLIYKLYNLVTGYSFRVRMVLLTMIDSEKKEDQEPTYAFLIEDEDQLALRVNAKLYKRDRFKPENLEEDGFHKMAVFAFMVGNTDWSIQFRHNIKLIYPEEIGRMLSVPYDFDLVGMVDAPYAYPAEALKMSSVKQRRYRGYCLNNLEPLIPVFNHFRELKKAFYDTFSDCTLLDEGYVKSMHQYLDEFYEIIDDRKKCEKAFLYPCDKHGTGNVILMGMEKNR